MNEKKYKLTYSIAEQVMLYVMLGLFVVTTVMNSLKLLGLFSLVSINPFIDWAGIVFSILMTLFIATTLLCSKYVIDDTGITEYISIFKKRILCSDISKIVYQEAKLSLFVIYIEKNKYNFLKLNVKKNLYDDIITNLRSINGKITYEILSKDNK